MATPRRTTSRADQIGAVLIIALLFAAVFWA